MNETAWECPHCHCRRLVDCKNEGVGVPACPRCQAPMERSDYDGWLSKGLEKLKDWPGGLGQW